jgi:hypothetical protein
MTSRDLQYLKRVTPAELMKLKGNGVPWEFCCLVKIQLTASKTLTIEQLSASPLKARKNRRGTRGALARKMSQAGGYPMSRRQCAECKEPFKTRGPGDGKRLAIWAVGLTGHTTAALLCAACHTRFEEHGTGGIPNAHRQSRGDAEAARNARNNAPLVPGTRRW